MSPKNVVADRGDGLALGRMSGLRVCPRVASRKLDASFVLQISVT